MRVLAVAPDRRNLEEVRKLTTGMEAITELTGHEGTLAGLTNLPVKGEPDVLVLDCRQQPMEGLADLERLLAFYPRLKVVLIVDRDSPELLLRALRLGVREVIKAPLSREDIQAAFQHLRQENRAVAGGEGKVLAFMSCKGGSGASFLATNLAYALAEQREKRVLLIDMNMQFGDAVLYVSDRRPRICLPDIVRDIQRIDMALLKSAVIDITPNYGILAAAEDPTQSVDVRPSHVESLIRFARANYDYVVLDVGRSLDTCSIQALDLADHIYPVMQLTLPFLRDAHRLFDVFRSLGYAGEKVRPIVNRVERLSGDLTEKDAEKSLGIKMFATIPNHYKSVSASVNQGIPILKLAPGSPVGACLQELSDRIADISPSHREKGLLGRLFKRD